MPALSEIGLGTEALRMAVWWARRERVSEIVVGDLWERRWIRDSIAVTGMVRWGSERRRLK